MTTMPRHKIPGLVLSIALIAALTGCDQSEQAVGSPGNQASVTQSDNDQQSSGHVAEFDGYTLRANAIRSDVLPDAMARQYEIEADADLVLLNLVILETRADQQPVPVRAQVSARHEGLTGHGRAIDMRPVEADGMISYIGTIEAGGQRHFQLVVEAQPDGTDEPLKMDFEVQLDGAVRR